VPGGDSVVATAWHCCLADFMYLKSFVLHRFNRHTSPSPPSALLLTHSPRDKQSSILSQSCSSGREPPRGCRRRRRCCCCSRAPTLYNTSQDMYLINVYPIGVHLTGYESLGRVSYWAYTLLDVYLISVYLIGVHFTKCAPHGRAPHGRGVC
jgi:hypothetical protein